MIPAMSESTFRPKQVADQLGISPATLRLWSNKFQSLLSPAAQRSTTETGTSAQRRYSDQDVRFFHRAKQLLGEGKTYEETLAILTEEGVPDPDIVNEPLPEAPAEEVDSETSAVALRSEMQIALISLREALATKDEVIEAQQQAISANERHVTDLQEENKRLRDQLTTLSDATKSPQKRVSWWERLLGRDESDGRSI